jgi:hypothetical protein
MSRTAFLLPGSAVLFLVLSLSGISAPLGPGRYAVCHALPSGIADAGGTIGYFEAPRGRLEALDLATGRVLWQADGPALPLAVWGRQPVAAVRVKGKPDRLRIVVLDGDGKVARASPEIKREGYVRGARGWWTSSADVAGDDLLLFDSWYWYGVKKPRAGDPLYTTLWSVNLRTGKVSSVRAGKTVLRPPFVFSTWLDKEVKGFPRGTEFVNGPGWSAEPQRLLDGSRLGIVWRKKVGSDEVLTLRTWDVAGTNPRTTELLRRPFGLHLAPSADGRHLFLQHKELAPGPPHRYSWAVYRVATGKRLGVFPHNGFTLRAGAAGGRVFLEETTRRDGSAGPAQLHAWDLKTGKLLWKRPAPPHTLGLPLGGER